MATDGLAPGRPGRREKPPHRETAQAVSDFNSPSPVPSSSQAGPTSPTGSPSPAPGRLALGERLLSHLIVIAELGTLAIVIPILALAGTLFGGPRVHFLLRGTSWLLLKIAGIRVRIRGRENLPSSGGFLIVSNHVNMFDPMIMYWLFRQHIIAIEKASHFHWPLYGQMIRSWGNLPVSGRAAETRESLGKAADLLRAGRIVYVFPEGTRARDGRLASFKRGAFHLALDARVPLVPIVFKGADRIFLEGSWTIRPGREEVVILPPVSLDGYTREDAGRLADAVHALIGAELER